MIERLGSKSYNGARMLLFSMRNVSRHVSRCSGYELEDLIGSCDTVDIIAPSLPRHRERTLVRRIKTALHWNSDPLIHGEVRVDKDYELFFAYCHSPWDLQYVDLVQGLDHCRKAVCLIEELWPSAIDRSRSRLETLKDFDFIFTATESSAGLIQE